MFLVFKKKTHLQKCSVFYFIRNKGSIGFFFPPLDDANRVQALCFLCTLSLGGFAVVTWIALKIPPVRAFCHHHLEENCIEEKVGDAKRRDESPSFTFLIEIFQNFVDNHIDSVGKR